MLHFQLNTLKNYIQSIHLSCLGFTCMKSKVVTSEWTFTSLIYNKLKYLLYFYNKYFTIVCLCIRYVLGREGENRKRTILLKSANQNREMPIFYPGSNITPPCLGLHKERHGWTFGVLNMEFLAQVGHCHSWQYIWSVLSLCFWIKSLC